MPATPQNALDGLHADIAIVGAGINGASTAQHLSAAGYRVLVVDQGDFADGATSRSSRLLHCGLRHLATGSGLGSLLLRPDRLIRALGIARADILSRDEIVRSIPHRVKPFQFCLPLYADDPYAPWQLDAAFALLRMMSPAGVALDYRRYAPQDLAAVPIAPWLRAPDRLRGLAVFREYQFDWAERIALDALFDARRMGAVVRNYTRLRRLRRASTSGRWHLTLEEVGAEGGGASEVTADIVLNLAGASVDDVLRQNGQAARQTCIGLKGIHIAVRLPNAFSDWGLFTYNSIGEPLYCLPWHGMHYIGLTRTPFTGNAATVVASDAEIDWMIAETNRCLPSLALSRKDVSFTWAGVQPVTYDAEDPKGNREIKIHDLAADGLPGILTLTGGAIMTHRRVATQLVSQVSRRLQPSMPPQLPNFAAVDADSEANAPRLVSDSGSVSRAAVDRSAQDEQPRSLADLLMRRLGLGWTGDQGLALARPVAEAAAQHLGWSQDRVDAEVEAYRAHLNATRRRPGTDPSSVPAP